MSRSKWKLPIVNKKLLESFLDKKKVIECPRNNTILKEYINQKVKVYNGKSFREFRVSEFMVGKKFGEFANSRRYFPNMHSKDKKKKKK